MAIFVIGGAIAGLAYLLHKRNQQETHENKDIRTFYYNGMLNNSEGKTIENITKLLKNSGYVLSSYEEASNYVKTHPNQTYYCNFSLAVGRDGNIYAYTFNYDDNCVKGPIGVSRAYKLEDALKFTSRFSFFYNGISRL